MLYSVFDLWKFLMFQKIKFNQKRVFANSQPHFLTNSFFHWFEMRVGFSILFLWSVCLFKYRYPTAAMAIGLNIFFLIWQASRDILNQSFSLQMFLCISSHFSSRLMLDLFYRFLLKNSIEILIAIMEMCRWIWGRLTFLQYWVFLSWNQVC